MRLRKIKLLFVGFAVLFAAVLPSPAAVYFAVSAAAGASITTDFWQDFEDATLNTTTLAARDHNNDGAWSITDTGGRLSTSTSGQQSFTSQINSDGGGATADSGTRGLALVQNDTEAAYCQFTWTSSPGSSAVSYAFWYKVPTLADSITEQIFSVNSDIDYCFRVGMINASSTYTFRVRGNGGWEDDTAGVTSGNWYRVEVKYAGSGADQVTLKVYNTAGTQVGSGQSVTGNASDQAHIIIGPFEGSASGHSGSPYYDNVIADRTDATHPLGP